MTSFLNPPCWGVGRCSRASRWALGILSVLAMLGGATLVLMTMVHFGFNGHGAPLTEHGVWDILAGTCALGVFTGSAFARATHRQDRCGLVSAGAGYVTSMILPLLVSLTTDPGGQRGDLETGAAGFIWLVAAAYCSWGMASRRWLVNRRSTRRGT